MHCKNWPWILELAPPETYPLPTASDFVHVMALIEDDDPDARIIISEGVGAVLCCRNENAVFAARMAAERSRILKRG